MPTEAITVPVIDLEAASAAEHGSDEPARARAAGEQLGIVQIVNHGVPLELIEDFHRRPPRAGRRLAAGAAVRGRRRGAGLTPASSRLPATGDTSDPRRDRRR